MIGSFRQPIGIPDDILPDSWKNVNSNTNDNDEQTCNAEENDDQNCQLMDDVDSNDDDPCAPYNNYNNNNNYDNNSDNNYNTHDDDDDLPTSTSRDDEFRLSYSSSTSATRSTRGHLYRGT